jgi:excisionase family DNA binding protein
MSDEQSFLIDESHSLLPGILANTDLSQSSKPKTEPVQSQFLSTAEAARMLGLSTTLVQTLVDQGELKGWKTRGGHRRISMDSIVDYQNVSRHSATRYNKSTTRPKVTVVIERAGWIESFRRDFNHWNLAIDVTFFDSVTEALLDLSSNRPDMIVVEMSTPRTHQEKTFQALENFNKRGQSPLSVVLVTEEKGLASSMPIGAASTIQLVPGPLSSVWFHAYLTGVIASCRI